MSKLVVVVLNGVRATVAFQVSYAQLFPIVIASCSCFSLPETQGRGLCTEGLKGFLYSLHIKGECQPLQGRRLSEDVVYANRKSCSFDSLSVSS